MRTTPDPVVVVEEHLPTVVALTAAQADAIRASAAGVTVTTTSRPGHYELRPSHIVGAVTVEGLRLVIQPKIPVARLLHMLTYSRSVPSFGNLGRFAEDFDLLEAMASQYARLLRMALSRGLVREYRERSEELVGLQGRPDYLNLVTRHFGIFPPLPCDFDEFSADTTPNRLMLAAAAQLGRIGSRNSTIADLRVMQGRFEGVQLVHFTPDRVPHPRLDRRHVHAAPAVRMAEAILRRISIELRDGNREAVTFLVDMNALYEDFVVEGLRNAMGVPPLQWVHHPTGIYLDTDRRLRLSPDALWRDRHGRPLVVVDAKYKVTSEPVRADLYQIVAYCQAIGVMDAVLVYPSTVPDLHVLVNSGVRIHRLPLDPDGHPDEVERKLRTLAEVLRRLVGRAAA